MNFRVLGDMEGRFSDSILTTLFSVGKDEKEIVDGGKDEQSTDGQTALMRQANGEKRKAKQTKAICSLPC